MARSRYEIVKELYLEIVDLDATDRLRRLEEVERSDVALRREVEDLLGYEDDTRAPVSSILAIVDDHLELRSAGAGPEAEMPATIGGYRIVRRIGVGGMGSVFEAEQEQPRRTVALKVLRSGLLDPAARRRFEVEAEILGRLQHPAITQVYEARHDSPDGPFIAMELVRGLALDSWVRAESRGRAELILLWKKIAEGVHHAHQRGIIHRDLKPGNILIDDEGRPKILDFGIARVLGEGRTTAARTRAGEILGTIAYMSPEQASGDPSLIDTRSDVYALGLLGYECLLRRAPHDLDALSFKEAMATICTGPIRRPAAIDPTISGDLETILLTSLDKDRERRYQSAAELARDLDNFLDEKPISAHPPSTWYEIRMFARRHRVAMLSLAALLCTIVIGITAVILYSVEAGRQARRANRESRRGALETLAARRSSYAAEIRAASAALDEGRRDEANRRLDSTPEELRGWEWRHLRSRLDTCELLFGDGTPVVGDVDFSSDGRILVAEADGRLRLIHLGAEGSEETIEVEAGMTSFSASRDLPIVATGHADGGVRIRDLAEGAVIVERDFGDESIEALEIGPAGERLLVTTASSSYLWMPAREHVIPIPRRSFWSWHPTEPSGVSTSYEQVSGLTGFREGKLSSSSETPICAAFSADAGRVVFGTNHPSIRVVDVGSERVAAYMRSPTGQISAVAWLPGAERVVSGDRSGCVRVWDVVSGKEVRALLGHSEPIRSLVVSPDGQYVAAATRTRVRVWRLNAQDGVSVAEGHRSYVWCGSFSPDSALVASAAWDATVRLWDGFDLAPIGLLDQGLKFPSGLAWTKDGRQLAISDWKIRILDLPSGEVELPTLERRQLVESLGNELSWPGRAGSPSELFLPGHRVSLLGDEDSDQLLIRDAQGRVLGRIAIPGGTMDLAASRDETRLAAVSGEGRIVLIDPLEWAVTARIRAHTGAIHAAAFTPDQSRLATGGDDQALRIWDTESWLEVATLHGHRGEIRDLEFSGDGQRLLSASSDGTLRLWGTRPLHERVRDARGAGAAPNSLSERIRGLVVERDRRRADEERPVKLEGETGSGFGTALALLERGPRNGERALLVGAPGAAPRQSGAVELWSLAPPERIWRRQGLHPGDGFGSSIVTLPDMDGDGVDDLAVGAPRRDGDGLENCGSLVFLSGRDGSTIREHLGARAFEELGLRATATGDLDRDGAPDVLCCPRPGRGARRIELVSSRTGALIRSFDVARQGLPAAHAVGDRDGDGIADLAIASPASGVTIHSGADGRELAGIPWSEAGGGTLATLAIRDQARAELRFVFGAKPTPQAGTGENPIEARSADGDTIWRVSYPRSIAGRRFLEVGDLDGDGIDEVGVVVGAFGARTSLSSADVVILSGADGREIRRLEGPAGAIRFGSAIVATPDQFIVGCNEADRPFLVFIDR
ncbi:MAG: protein kinase [Planctomycetes bacterium]|nr:protein kinase [Planctomycetota bacterium]